MDGGWQADRSSREALDRLSLVRERALGVREPPPIFDTVARLAAGICDAAQAGVCIRTGAGLWFKGVFGFSGEPAPALRAACETILAFDRGGVLRSIGVDPPDGPKRVTAIPLFIGDGPALGLLWVATDGGAELTEAAGGQLDDLARVAEAHLHALQLGRSYRRSESRLRAVSALVPDLLWSRRSDGSPAWFNPSWYAYTGLTEAAAAREGWSSGIHPDDREAARAASIHAMSRGEAFAQKQRLRRHDGAYRWFWVRAEPLRDEAGAISEWVAAAADIHDAFAGVAALEESEQRFREMADDAPVQVWVTDANGDLSFVSRSWYEFTGLPRGTAPGAAWLRTLHPEDQARVTALLRDDTAARRTFRHEFRLRASDGSWRWVLNVGRPRFGAGGTFLGYIGSVLDIGDRKEAEEALRTSEQRLLLALEAGQMASWTLDLEAGSCVWSEGHFKLLGYRVGEVEPGYAAWYARVHPDDADWVGAQVLAAMQTGDDLAMRYRILLPSSEVRWIETRGRLQASGGRRWMNGIILDVTAQKRGEEDLAAMQQNLLQVSRLGAMGAMASALAHELNQPLTAIAAALHAARRLLQVSPESAPMADEAIEQAAGQALRAGEIIRRIRGFALEGRVDARPTPLVEVIASVREGLLRRGCAPGDRLRVNLGHRRIVVMADPIQLEQVLENLVRNAFDAIEGDPAGQIVIAGRIRGATAEISVADNGCGFPPERIADLFQPFRTAKANGTGLGLSICRTIVEAHGGQIQARNRDTGGAQVVFTVPLVEDDAPTPA